MKNYFSAADLAVLPYRSATQSGISAIASHFGVPMVVTDVGGLKDDIGAFGTGLVASQWARRSWQQFGEELTNFIEHLD